MAEMARIYNNIVDKEFLIMVVRRLQLTIGEMISRLIALPSTLFDFWFERPPRITNIRTHVKSDNYVSDGRDSTEEWLDNLGKLTNYVSSTGGASFLRHSTILRTMFVTNRFFTFRELIFLRKELPKLGLSNEVLVETSVGDPYRSIWYPRSSGNQMHHCYSLAFYLKRTGKKISDFDQIVEFGGGYGGFARVCRRFGFDGHYTIFDFSEMLFIQSYYLEQCHDIDYLDGPKSYRFISCTDDLRVDEFDNEKILFVALWSLSEAPILLRQSFEPFLERSYGILVAFQDSFAGIDNQPYFSNFLKTDTSIEEASLLPGNNFYLFK